VLRRAARPGGARRDRGAAAPHDPVLHHLSYLRRLPGGHQEAVPQAVGGVRRSGAEDGRGVRSADPRHAWRRRRRPAMLRGLAPHAARGRGGRPAAHGRRDDEPVHRVPDRRHGHDGDGGGVDHGGAGEPPRRPGQGARRGEERTGRRPPAPGDADAVPQGRRAGGPAAAPAGPLRPAARRARRRGDRRLHCA